jgi:hypothetical protein
MESVSYSGDPSYSSSRGLLLQAVEVIRGSYARIGVFLGKLGRAFHEDILYKKVLSLAMSEYLEVDDSGKYTIEIL